MKSYKSLVKKALSLGFTVSVWDGEEWQVSRTKDEKAIYGAIESVEEAQLRFRSPTEVVGWALIVPDLDDDETVADHNTYDEEIPHSIKFQWMDQWSGEYYATTA